MNTAANRIRAEITGQGEISFARFMELALYCPDCGYYEKENDSLGRRGDFYTSVNVGRLFGELLAFQFAAWLAEPGACKSDPQFAPCQLVEAGAHHGQLAKDVLTWLREQRLALFESLEYWILEPSATRRAKQAETLREFVDKLNWAGTPAELGAQLRHRAQPAPGVCGIIFSNELLDALPVHRLGWDAKRGEWFEWGVTWREGRFGWTRLAAIPQASPLTLQASPELLDMLPDGFTTEICPAAVAWWREAAQILQHGKLLTIDYGLSAEEFLTVHRARGTLRAYYRHRLTDDVLAQPGEQDLTAHVNFTAVQSAGEAAGLLTKSTQTQARFLTDIARRAWEEGSGFGLWTPDRTRQFQTLTHPEHLGRAFRVVVQAR
ncbi:MAG: SAM-dependent methyltransferase [Verrucomicrobia bacterium]|nr:SAM-dependent methyltransferase [Verrucomicrobiota bacterium]